jgi:hypothetical protein
VVSSRTSGMEGGPDASPAGREPSSSPGGGFVIVVGQGVWPCVRCDGVVCGVEQIQGEKLMEKNEDPELSEGSPLPKDLPVAHVVREKVGKVVDQHFDELNQLERVGVAMNLVEQALHLWERARRQ